MLAEAAVAAQPGNAPRAGRIYKWVDEHGVTHYGQAIPPEYRQADRWFLLDTSLDPARPWSLGTE